jgi:hypothetical protein
LGVFGCYSAKISPQKITHLCDDIGVLGVRAPVLLLGNRTFAEYCRGATFLFW